MGIAFLTPLFLAGLALLAIPVVIHLRRRHQSQVVAFPSLMFLRQIQQASRRQRRIRHWTLLALRSLALAALVFAFARPLFRSDAIAADRTVTGREVVLLLDNSFSMGFEDRFARALSAASERVAGLRAEDRATVIVFSDRAAIEAEATGDRDHLAEVLAAVKLSPRGTRYTPALKLARKAILDSPLPQREVVLITDFQRVGWERGEDLRLPPGTTVSFVDLSAGSGTVPPANLAVASVVLDRSLDSDRERIGAQARVTRRGGEGDLPATLVLEIGGRELGRQQVVLQPDASSLVAFEPFSLPQGISRGRLLLEGDALAADNELSFVLSRAQSLPVVVLEEKRQASASSGFYVEQALRLGQEPLIEVRRRAPSGLAAGDLAQAGVVVASDVALDAGAARLLRAFVERGGGLLVALGSRSEGTHATLAAAGLAPASAGEDGAEPGSRIARIAFLDRAHPGLEPFANARSGDFGTARFFRHRKVHASEEDVVLARFDNGDAALIERKVGSGRVLVWTSTLDTYWNDFALQPVFLPFLHQVVKTLAGFRPPAPWHTVGDVVDLASTPGLTEAVAGAAEAVSGTAGSVAGAAGSVTAVGPDGESVSVTDVLELAQRGFYVLARDGAEVGMLAANVDVRESDLAAVDAEELVATLRPLGEDGAVEENGALAEQTPSEREASQGLWRYLVLGVLLLLVAEVFVANRLSATAG